MTEFHFIPSLKAASERYTPHFPTIFDRCKHWGLRKRIGD